MVGSSDLPATRIPLPPAVVTAGSPDAVVEPGVAVGTVGFVEPCIGVHVFPPSVLENEPLEVLIVLFNPVVASFCALVRFAVSSAAFCVAASCVAFAVFIAFCTASGVVPRDFAQAVMSV